MPETAFFAPEIEELLREVASDPRSTLLRVPRPKVLRTFFEHDPTVSQHATGLRAAERELLRTHRDELAKLLREACVMKLYGHPAAKGRMLRHVTATQVLSIPNKVALRERFRRERRSPVGPLGLDDALLLDACTEVDGVDQPTIGQLAALSLRLHPTTQARIYAAENAVLEGLTPDALLLLDAAASFDEAPLLLALIACNQGAAYCDLGRFDAGRDAYGHAASGDDPPLIAVISWLRFALLTNNSEAAREACTKLDALVNEQHPAVQAAAQNLPDLQLKARWTLDNRSRQLALDSRDNCGAAARKIIDATLH